MSTLVNLIQEEDVKALAQRLQKYLNPESIKSETEPIDSQKTYSVKEVSKITGRDKQTIRSHIRLKLLNAKKSGKSFIITQGNLKKYIENEK